MVYFAVALVCLLALMVLVLYRQQFSHMIDLRTSENEWRRERAVILEHAQQERASLLDRIQHPQYHQPTEPIIYDPPHTPKDLEELGFVGEEVPDFYHVGYPDEAMMGEVIPDDA